MMSPHKRREGNNKTIDFGHFSIQDLRGEYSTAVRNLTKVWKTEMETLQGDRALSRGPKSALLLAKLEAYSVLHTVLSRYIVDLETWSTSKHSLGKKTKVGKDSRPQNIVDFEK